MATHDDHFPTKATCIYVAIATAWLLFTQVVLPLISVRTPLLAAFVKYESAAVIAGSAIALYALLARSTRRRADVDAARARSDRDKADSANFLQAVLDSSGVGILAFKGTGEAVAVNKRAAKLADADEATLLQQNFRQMPSWVSSLLPAAERALSSGSSVVVESQHAFSPKRTLWLEAQFVPFTFAGDQHLLLMIHDESGRRLALQKLQMLQSAVQAAPSGWMVTDASGRILSVNPAFTAMTGFTEAEAMGRNPRFLKSGKQSDSFYATLWATVKRGEVWTGTMINRRKDGSFYHEHNTIAPVCSPDGAITHFVSLKNDITDKERLEAQLSRIHRLDSIGQLAVGVVHDLNNILLPIVLSLGLLRDKHARDPDTLNHIKMMEASAQRGASVLRQVLTFARGADGERMGVGPRMLFQEIVTIAEETFPRNIRISTTFTSGVSNVMADLTQLHQVLLNLAVNARDAMPRGGTMVFHAENVTVDASMAVQQLHPVAPGSYVKMGVRDSGEGIPSDVMEHIFDPFFTTKPRDKGTGLGLATAFGIVRSHGGFFQVDSTVGKGTDFCFLLPIAKDATVLPEKEVEAILGFQGKGKRVLLVDDEDAVLRAAHLVLERHGFSVSEAQDGSHGWEMFSANPRAFDAVFSDLMMPGMDGHTLATKVREVSPSVHIILASGTGWGAFTDAKPSLADLRVQSVLQKPYTESELISALRTAFAQA